MNKNSTKKQCFNCARCGECCHIREFITLSEAEEKTYKNFMFKEFGIIYLAPLNQITINIWPEEVDVLKEEAKKKKIELKIKPKRAIYDAKKNQLIIVDYYMDHDICPFFNKIEKICTIHSSRPTICRSYPLTSTKSYGKCKYKLLDFNSYEDEMIHAFKLDELVKKEKEIIKKMISSNQIEIPKSISENEFENIVKTASITELRIKKI